MGIKRQADGLSWFIDKIGDVYFYFQVALLKQPFLSTFIIMITIGFIFGIKEVFFKNKEQKENNENINYKKLIFGFLLINLILLVWGYFIVFK